MSDATEFAASLRKFADWFDANPDMPAPLRPSFLIPLHTNDAVREFATAQGWEVKADDGGNLSADITIGQIVYRVYGYTDFEQYKADSAEQDAREWAEKQGLEFVKKASE